MDIFFHDHKGSRIAELNADSILIGNEDDALQLFIDLSYQDAAGIIVHEQLLAPTFFNLSSGLAGAILQKCSNYNIRLAIVGRFDQYPGQSLKGFIVESNKGRQVNFLPSVAEALEKLSV